MRFQIVVSDKKKGEIRIPLSKKEVCMLLDLCFYFEDDDWKNFRLNKIDTHLESFIKKVFCMEDILHDGRVYNCDLKTKKLKFKLDKTSRHWLNRKPEWTSKFKLKH